VFVLPKEFLAHFGYNEHTIYPYATINHNDHYLRFASTLRGANPLGAYLIVPLSLLAVLIARGRRHWTAISLFVAGLVMLFFSFSRAAWIGMLLSLSIIAAIKYKQLLMRKQVLALLAVGLIVLSGLGIMLRQNARLQNIILHTEDKSAIQQTSNEGHISATIAGIKEVARHPLGEGTGASGPASYYNGNKTQIPENYFLQIGEETGWLGLALFGLINIGVGYLLWLRRADPLALSLFASLIGLTFVNLLSHAWADDTLAYIWWGLAGIAMVTVKRNAKKS
jgi:hypothetical protein